MRAYWYLLTLPVRRFPIGGVALVILSGLMLVPMAIAAPRELDKLMLVVCGAILFLWGALSGNAFAGLARPEVRMLPNYRPRLLQALATQTLTLGIVPTALLMAGPHDLITGVACLLFAQALGLLIGVGAQVGLFFWALGLSMSIAPKPMIEIAVAVWQANSSWLMLLAAAGLALRHFLKRVLPLRDDAPVASPMELSSGTRQIGADGLRERRMGAFNRKIFDSLNRIADNRLQRISDLLAAKPDELARRRHALRAMLLPYDSPLSIALQVAMTVLILGLAALLLSHGLREAPVQTTATYALIIAAMRYVNLHRAYITMRASLADTYLALAPGEVRAFHRELCDAYAWHIPTAIIVGLCVFAFLLPFVPRQAWAPTLIFATLSLAIVSASGYGLFLLLTDAPRARTLFTSLTQAAIALACAVFIAHPALEGNWLRAIAAGTVGAGFAIGLVAFARREAASRRPVFDPAI